MLKNYLTVALRNLRRHTGYTVINVTGLSIGIACCVLILLYAGDELGYDRFQANIDRIYRVVHETHDEDGVEFSARSPVPLGPTLADEFPMVEHAVRFWRAFQPVLGYEENIFRVSEELYFTDPSALQVFSFDFIRGDAASALNTPGSIVLTESMANKYFGSSEALGKVLDYAGYPGAGDVDGFAVTGVIKDLPHNTHLKFGALASLEGISTETENFGSFKPIWTYVLLPDGVDPEHLERQFPDFVERHMNFAGEERIMRLEPVADIHLRSSYVGGFTGGGSLLYLNLIAAIGAFILLIACINFVNLATARSMSRAREVGMRKVLGAFRPQLVIQFLGEAIVLSLLAMALALAVVGMFLPVFNGLFGKSLVLDFTQNRTILVAIPLLTIVVGLLAGSYPALFLSRFATISALKGSLASRPSGARMRKALVVFQFGISVVLIAATLVVYQQLDYVRTAYLGFDDEQVVVVPSPSDGREQALIATLRDNPNIVRVSLSQRVPASPINRDGRPVVPEGFSERVGVDSYIIDEDFVETFGMELAAGRNLSSSMATDTAAFLINETAARRFGWATPQDALGKEINWTNGPTTGPVVGVLKDFHFESMHEAIGPVVMHMRPGDTWWRTFVSAKIRPDDVAGTLAFIEQSWRAVQPDGAFDYFFVDDSFAALHRADERFGPIFRFFALLAIGLACLGLFGLAAFTAEQRAKEIGVRKVLGASLGGIVWLFSREFGRLVAVSFVIAVPLAYVGMSRWLENYAYRVDLSWPIFAAAGATALCVALATVSYQAIRVALANPTSALRCE